jgi:hypothetical protein
MNDMQTSAATAHSARFAVNRMSVSLLNATNCSTRAANSRGHDRSCALTELKPDEERGRAES